MRRIRLIIAYDGTNYCGWQKQPNAITVEEMLGRAVCSLTGEETTLTGASRTDSGVHALGNVAVFDTEARIAADKVAFALNVRLPEDIRVLKSDEVPCDWHPRKRECVKTYEYRILNTKIEVPTLRLYSHFCYYDLDTEKMQEGASFIMGTHDFTSFCSVKSQALSPVRTVTKAEVRKDGNMIVIHLEGGGFLYNMVRIIAGTLVQVGMGVYPPEHVKEIIEARDRRLAGQTMPARGLTLIGIDYLE